jgi:hypothetical protein
MTGSGRHNPIEDAHYTAPLYRKTEAARIIRVPASTLRSWADGAELGGSRHLRKTSPFALITSTEPSTPRGPSVPFVGLTEAFVLAAFRSAGVPMQRIRPAISWLQDNIGLRQALASERLRTDGAEVLWDYASQNDDTELVEGLVVIRNGQQVFRPVVKDYLRRVTTRKDGRASSMSAAGRWM